MKTIKMENGSIIKIKKIKSKDKIRGLDTKRLKVYLWNIWAVATVTIHGVICMVLEIKTVANILKIGVNKIIKESE